MNRGQRRAQWRSQHRAMLQANRAAARPAASAGRESIDASQINAQQITASSVRLHIDELVLHGFPAGSRHSIGEATQQELSRLLIERGVPEGMLNPREIARVDAGSFQVARSAKPDAIGALVADAVYGGCNR